MKKTIFTESHFYKFYFALALNPAWPAGRLTPTSGLVLKKSTSNLLDLT
jgi:hypothetical protein